jgi:hypothetical protein
MQIITVGGFRINGLFFYGIKVVMFVLFASVEGTVNSRKFPLNIAAMFLHKGSRRVNKL